MPMVKVFLFSLRLPNANTTLKDCTPEVKARIFEGITYGWAQAFTRFELATSQIGVMQIMTPAAALLKLIGSGSQEEDLYIFVVDGDPTEVEFLKSVYLGFDETRRTTAAVYELGRGTEDKETFVLVTKAPE